MKKISLLSCFVVLFPLAAVALADEVRFNRDIRQILADKCYRCHGPDEKTRESDLRFDLEEAVFQDRDQPVIVRGKPDQSELVRRITSTDPDIHMPPPDAKKPLTDREKTLLQQWIAEGAKWEGHWAFIPPRRVDVPAIPGQPELGAIDCFVRRRLDRENLSPSPVADPVTLTRRLHFDLTGLPPSPAEVDAFAKDPSRAAYEEMVNRLLDSKHFGERMAIYWLDVVRYADSNGYHSDEARAIAPFRDYVIDAFNQNKPYNEFVIEHLAGDLLPDATPEQQIASGFNMLLQTTNEGGAQAKEYLAKYSADRVRNTSSIFLGITMGCCECHDHKFDPFTQKDFYSFAAFFADIQEKGVGNPPAYPVRTPEYDARLRDVETRIAERTAELNTASAELEKEQLAWEQSLNPGSKSSLTLQPWQVIGPFTAASFDDAHTKAFPPETEIDLTKTYGDLKWQQNDKFVDGQIHNLVGDNSATYLYRVIKSGSNMPLELSLGSDDGIRVWLNGTQVLDQKVLRGVAPDQNKLTVNLVAGENRLLLKVSNGSGGYGFYFNPIQTGLPQKVVNALQVPAAERNDQQKRDIADYYRSISPSLKSIRDEITKLEEEKKQIHSALPKTLMTKAGNPRTIRLLNRGNWMDDSGPEMMPAIPARFGALDNGDKRATRLDLANWIVDPSNPLTARTYVNRLWKLFFGHGIATPLDDLGAQGTDPTHPELIDWLAQELIDSGWDTKHMVRLMVTSHAYQQDSRMTEELKLRDPYNKLYARQSRFRLDAEIVRDNALAISGLLVDRVGGPSVKPYQPNGYWRHMNFPKRSWKADPDDNIYRRGLYTWWQRMFLHPSLLAFDAPSREECTVERPRSNTPQQALVLLNDPTYVEAARTFAERILREGGADTGARLDWAYRQAVSRSPRPTETAVLNQVHQAHLAHYHENLEAAKKLIATGRRPVPADIAADELAAWTSVARVILNLHETISRM